MIFVGKLVSIDGAFVTGAGEGFPCGGAGRNVECDGDAVAGASEVGTTVAIMVGNIVVNGVADTGVADVGAFVPTAGGMLGVTVGAGEAPMNGESVGATGGT